MKKKLKLKPDFFIIGAAKAATTSLSSLLEQHPNVGIVRGKEPHFFSMDDRYRLGWEKYQSLFMHCNKAKAIGDASTSYSRIRYYPDVVKRIKQHVPRAKIIYMVRHPLDRMVSAYVEHMASETGKVFDSINDAVVKQPMIIDSSRYWEVFQAYTQEFSEKRVKIIWFEEYINNQVEVYQDVCNFLGIRKDITPDLSKANNNTRLQAEDRMTNLGNDDVVINTVWDHDVKQRVINSIREDNIKFLSHFGKPANHWGDLYD
jgi:hypothetical protein